MTDPDTIASLAAEFSLNPDVVRLIMDAAEQHPGVVDPIALGRAWKTPNLWPSPRVDRRRNGASGRWLLRLQVLRLGALHRFSQAIRVGSVGGGARG